MTPDSAPAKLALSLLCLATTTVTTTAWATEYGSVVSATPLVMAVPIPQRQCSEEPVVYQQPGSGAGAVIGAIAGAAIGNSIGSGAGRAAATGIGLIAGAEIGSRVEADATPPVAGSVQRCRTVTRYENRTVAWDVVYEYQGVRRSVRMAQDPGDRIALDVTVSPAGALAPDRTAAAPPAPLYAAPAPEVVYEQAPPPRVVYGPGYYGPAYYGPSYYVSPWPVIAGSVILGWPNGGYRGGGRHRH